MRTLSLTAYAKVNLALDILGRRDDGYHTMRMVMQAVSLGDTVTVTETAGGFALLAEGLELPPDRKTMEQQAAAAPTWRRCCDACGGCTARRCRCQSWRPWGPGWAATWS